MAEKTVGLLRANWQVASFATIGIASIVVWGWSLSGDLVCVKGTMNDTLQKTISTLDATIDLGIKLSVSLIAAGAALLIGLSKGPPLTLGVNHIIVVCVAILGQSALAGVVWKLRIANGWLNECLNVVKEPYLQRLFFISYSFFLLALVCILIVVFVASLRKVEGTSS